MISSYRYNTAYSKASSINNLRNGIAVIFESNKFFRFVKSSSLTNFFNCKLRLIMDLKNS